jgi:hypothetical protein
MEEIYKILLDKNIQNDKLYSILYDYLKNREDIHKIRHDITIYNTPNAIYMYYNLYIQIIKNINNITDIDYIICVALYNNISQLLIQKLSKINWITIITLISMYDIIPIPENIITSNNEHNFEKIKEYITYNVHYLLNKLQILQPIGDTLIDMTKKYNYYSMVKSKKQQLQIRRTFNKKYICGVSFYNDTQFSDLTKYKKFIDVHITVYYELVANDIIMLPHITFIYDKNKIHYGIPDLKQKDKYILWSQSNVHENFINELSNYYGLFNGILYNFCIQYNNTNKIIKTIC